MGTTTEPKTKTPPDRSKETKLVRALDAISSCATAYFNDGEVDTALALRKHHAEISHFKAGE